MGTTALRTDSDLAGRASRGAVATLAGEVGVRLLGFVVTAAIAVRLDTHAYGVALLAIAVHGFVDVVTNPMLSQVLLRDPHAGRRLVDIAWTLGAARGVLLAGLFWCLAPWLAALWPDEHATLTVYFRILALSFVFSGITNLHLVQWRRELRFLPALLIESASPVASSVFGLVALLVAPDPVWLVVAPLVGIATTALLSLLCVAPRPRLAFDRAVSVDFGRGCAPMILYCTLHYVLFMGDAVAVDFLAGAAALGMYGMGQRWSQMPMRLLVQGLQTVLLPVYARMQGDSARTEHVVATSLSTILTILGPVAGLVLAFAPDFFAVLGGSKWGQAADVARAFVPFGVAFAVHGCLALVLMVHNRMRWLNWIMVGQIAGMFPAIYLGHHLLGLPGVALGIASVTVAFGAGVLLLSTRLLDMRLATVAGVLWPPLAASTVAVAIGWSLVQSLQDPLSRLCSGSAITIAAFVVAWEALCRRASGEGPRPRSLVHLARMVMR